MASRRKKPRMEDKDKGVVVDEDETNVEGADLTSDSKSTQSTRSHRGRTHMHCLSLQRVQGVKKDVDFNDMGQPVGPVAAQMQSYIGVLAREKVKITYDSWKSVPTDVKDLIWESVNLCFNVDPRWKGDCLSSANAKWRQFKTKLTNEFVYGRIESSDLNTPPAQYPCIDGSDWSAFVISRLSDNFKKLREQQQGIRAQHKYPYRFSRKGYARYANEHPDLLCEDDEINQATLWVEGRKTKDGTYEGVDLREKVAKIDEYIAAKKAGTLKKQGNLTTILEQALDKEEHTGRLRGVGSHMTQMAYYRVPKGNKSSVAIWNHQQKEFLEEKKRNEEQDERIRRLEAVVYKMGAPSVDIDEKGSCSVQCKQQIKEEKSYDADDDLKLDMDDGPDVEILKENAHLQGKLVALSLESRTDIAGYGTIVKVYGPEEHNLDNCFRVAIDEAVEEDALLPIPTDECHSIGDAVGSHVAWPIHLVKLREESPMRKKQIEKRMPTLDFKDVPKELRMVYCYCKASLEGKCNIIIHMDDDTFGHERTLYIHVEDVEPFCNLKPIPYMCIAVYIWHLYNKMKNLEKDTKFRFADPMDTGHIPSTRHDKKSVNERMEQRARGLANRLVGTLPNQFVLVPVNVGEHWILTIVDPHKEEIGLLDPLHTGNRDGVWKQVCEMALKMFNAKMMNKGRKKPTWTVIKAPKQPDGYQCGYYVMMYMREIVHSQNFDMIGDLQSLFNMESYSIIDINKVRKEWAECVQEYIIE